MEKIIFTIIGSHKVKIQLNEHDFLDFFQKSFTLTKQVPSLLDIHLDIKKGYGVPFVNYDVQVTKRADTITFQRADYLIESTNDYSSAKIHAYNEFALKHALTNLYSSYIVYHNWGLLIHSSCVINNQVAHMFSGRSGAGKSTAAKLSTPRQLLSDEATLVRISPDEIMVFNSPFRSEIESNGRENPVPLKSIQLLKQALFNERNKIKKADALLELMDKVFYWAHTPEETRKILSLLRELVNQTPVFELNFQKNNTFWELIS
jgi:hypothetical protein